MSFLSCIAANELSAHTTPSRSDAPTHHGPRHRHRHALPILPAMESMSRLGHRRRAGTVLFAFFGFALRLFPLGFIIAHCTISALASHHLSQLSIALFNAHPPHCLHATLSFPGSRNVDHRLSSAFTSPNTRPSQY